MWARTGRSDTVGAGPRPSRAGFVQLPIHGCGTPARSLVARRRRAACRRYESQSLFLRDDRLFFSEREPDIFFVRRNYRSFDCFFAAGLLSDGEEIAHCSEDKHVQVQNGPHGLVPAYFTG